MSATQQESLLHKEANDLSQPLYGCSFDELDENEQTFILQIARRFLCKRGIALDEQPGVCHGCGRSLPFEMTECRTCHDPIDVARADYAMRKGRW